VGHVSILSSPETLALYEEILKTPDTGGNYWLKRFGLAK
jgi:hypothetical protein